MAFNPINWLLGLFSLDIAIDLGTANTLVNVRGKGIVINEPSWVTIDKRLRQPLAIGLEAKEMMGRTPANVAVVRPLRDGVISEFDITQIMLEYFIGRVHEQSVVPLPRPRVVVGIPTGVTEVEKRAVYDAVMASGARSAYMIEEPIAAALGAGLPITDIRGSMVVDIGGGTTEVAIMSLADIAVCESVRVAGDDMDEAIINHMKRTYNLMVGEQTAERIKIEIGSAAPVGEETTMDVRGRDMISGLPRKAPISSEEIREALQEPVNAIIETVTRTLERAEPELAADLVENGITLAGGGSLLRGLPQVVQKATGLDCRLAEDPLTCVARGTAIYLENIEVWGPNLETDMDL